MPPLGFEPSRILAPEADVLTTRLPGAGIPAPEADALTTRLPGAGIQECSNPSGCTTWVRSDEAGW